MKENNLKDKCSLFGIRIVKLSKHLQSEHHEFVMSKQILRCGTSVGANVTEAEQGESKKYFVHELGISLKEINETIYWLDLLLLLIIYCKKNTIVFMQMLLKLEKLSLR